MKGPFPKTCACGAVHDAASWARLLFRGYMADREINPDGERLELRDCTCGSTIAIVVDTSGDRDAQAPV